MIDEGCRTIGKNDGGPSLASYESPKPPAPPAFATKIVKRVLDLESFRSENFYSGGRAFATVLNFLPRNGRFRCCTRCVVRCPVRVL